MSQPNPTVGARTIARHLEHAGAAGWQLESAALHPARARSPAIGRAAQMVDWAREAYSYEAVRLLCEAARSCLADVEEFAAQVDFSFGRPGPYEEHRERLTQLQVRLPSVWQGGTSLRQLSRNAAGLTSSRHCLDLATSIAPNSPWIALYSALTYKASGDNPAAEAELLQLTRTATGPSVLHHAYRNLLSCMVDQDRSADLAPMVLKAEALAPTDPAWAFYHLAFASSVMDIRAFKTHSELLIDRCTDADRHYWAESVALYRDAWAQRLELSPDALDSVFEELEP